MTVRVVSESPVKTKRVVCHNCGYELEFTGEDVMVTVGCDGDVQSIYCPRKQCHGYAFESSTRIFVSWP
jgi:hypothetical protein